MTAEQFTPLAERYMDTVFRVAYSYLRCRDDADDVTQDVLIQLYRQDKAFESDAHVKNWLIRVTVNRCKNVLRAPWHRAEDIADYENTLVFEQPQYRELFEAVIAVNLAVMNLLPLPALDGGRIFFLFVNAVAMLLFKKQIPAKYENYIHFAGLILLLALMVVLVFSDVGKLIK